jgi:hypothetical protein
LPDKAGADRAMRAAPTSRKNFMRTSKKAGRTGTPALRDRDVGARPLNAFRRTAEYTCPKVSIQDLFAAR